MGVVRLQDMSHTDAERLAASYLDALPAKVDALRVQFAATGADAGRLDGTPASLEPLWRWIVDWYDAGGAEEPSSLPTWYQPDPPG